MVMSMVPVVITTNIFSFKGNICFQVKNPAMRGFLLAIYRDLLVIYKINNPVDRVLVAKNSTVSQALR